MTLPATKLDHRGLSQIERASPKVNVWCGLFSDMVVGPFFFDEKTFTEAIFLKMLKSQIIPSIWEKQPDMMFQLDGAPPHWSLVVRERPDTAFPGRFFLVVLCKNIGFYWRSQKCWITEKKNQASFINSHSCNAVEHLGRNQKEAGKTRENRRETHGNINYFLFFLLLVC